LEAGEEEKEEEDSDLAGEEDKFFKKVRFSAPLLVWSLKILVTKLFKNLDKSYFYYIVCF